LQLSRASYGPALRLRIVVLELPFALKFCVFSRFSAGHDLVESTVVSTALDLIGLLRPADLMAVAVANIRLLGEGLVLTVESFIDLLWDFFEALLGHVGLLEEVNGCHIVRDVSQQIVIVFRPELLSLLQEQA